MHPSPCVPAQWQAPSPQSCTPHTPRNRYLEKYKLAPVLSEAEVEHWLLPAEGVVCSYVVEPPGGGGALTDLVSFYSLPSSVLGNAEYDSLKARFPDF